MVFGRVLPCFLHDFFHGCPTSYEVTIESTPTSLHVKTFVNLALPYRCENV